MFFEDGPDILTKWVEPMACGCVMRRLLLKNNYEVPNLVINCDDKLDFRPFKKKTPSNTKQN